jgi:CubicO group peptidase (beta-lactamase class C family)
MLPHARALGILALLAAPAAAAPLAPLPPQPAGVPWPTTAWPTAEPEVTPGALDRLLAVTAAPQPLLGETRAVVVVHRGRLVAERYMPGFGPATPLISWSMAKSITHAMLGIAVRQGLVDPDQPMGNPRWSAGEPRARVTWRQWVGMVDGQDWHEIRHQNPTENDSARMLFGPGRLDVAAYAAALPLVNAPGTTWNYNSGGITLVAEALGRRFAAGATTPAARRAGMAEAMKRELFGPIGMTSAQPEFDAQGTFMGSALLYATARDFARFGLLYLRDGVWEGKRLLPAGWVDFARTRNPSSNSDVYGAGFWITPVEGTGHPLRALAPRGPRDLFAAHGHEGQLVVIVPSRDLVVVRLGLLDDRKGWPALGSWIEDLVALFPGR